MTQTSLTTNADPTPKASVNRACLLKKHILVADNDADVLKSVCYNLSLEGYHPYAAENPEAALQQVKDNIIHCAIIDLRLEDNGDGLDQSGFKLSQMLPSYIPFIIFTAYENVDNAKQAFRDMGAKEVINKRSPEAPDMLLDAVNTVFENEVKLNFNLVIEGNLSLETIATSIEMRTSITTKPSEDDICTVLQRLFADNDRIHIKLLLEPEIAPTFSQSGAMVIQIQPCLKDKWGVPVVVKLGDRLEVAQEASNYRKIQPFLGGLHVTVLDEARGTAYSREIGGVVYSLIGSEYLQVRSFFEIYDKTSTVELVECLNRFFRITYKTLFANATRDTFDLTTLYQSQLPIKLDKLRTFIHELYPDAVTQRQLKFEGVERAFENPLYTIFQENTLPSFEVLSYRCLLHGDLHSRNILVDNEGHFWLIDFAKVADSHILRDFIELETDIKFNLLKETNLSTLFELEEALLDATYPHDEVSEVMFHNPKLDHAYQIVCTLRQLVRELCPSQIDMLEYYQALYLNTLHMIRLKHIDDGKKMHALLSVCLLWERIQQWPRKPSVQPSSITLDTPEPLEVVTDTDQLHRIKGMAVSLLTILTVFLILFAFLPGVIASLGVTLFLFVMAMGIAGRVSDKDLFLIIGEIVSGWSFGP
ncbi:MAG: response regulator [Chloroflexota bacterium]